MKKYLSLLPFVLVVGCTSSNTDISDPAALRSKREEILLEKARNSSRLAFFYVPTPEEEAGQVKVVTEADFQNFKQKSGLYGQEEMKTKPVAELTKQYKLFVQANANNPSASRFRCETAELLLSRAEPIPTYERLYLTNELITNRSDDVRLIRESVKGMKGKLSAAEYSLLKANTSRLFDQYEKWFADSLAAYSKRKCVTFRERATNTIWTEFSRQGMALMQENRRLLENDQVD